MVKVIKDRNQVIKAWNISNRSRKNAQNLAEYLVSLDLPSKRELKKKNLMLTQYNKHEISMQIPIDLLLYKLTSVK